MAEPSPTLRDVWRDQRMWSRATNTLKRDLTGWRAAALGLIAAGALLEAAAAARVAGDSQVLAYAGAMALAAVPVIRAAKLTSERMRDWVRARSTSEALKAEAYVYLTRTGVYNGPDAEAQLAARAADIQDAVADLRRHAVAHAPAEAVAPPAARLSIDEYVKARVDDQIDGYYDRKAGEMSRRLAWLRRLEFALSLLAAALGAVAAQSPAGGFAVWAPVATTVLAAITAHIEAGRYEYQSIAYLGTAQRLRRLRNAWQEQTRQAPPTPEQEAEFVRRSEEAIASENQSWMSELLESRTAGQGTRDPKSRQAG